MSEPGERVPAPGPLRLVQRFVNTIDLEDGSEQLSTPAQLRAWLADAGLLARGARVSGADLEQARALREAIRALLEAHAGEAPVPEAVAQVNAIARRAGLAPVLTTPSESRLEPRASRGVDTALGKVVAAIHAAIAEGTWDRLKACERHACRWAFYDHSRNRGGRWCSMAVCGSREKSRRAYRRRRAGA